MLCQGFAATQSGKLTHEWAGDGGALGETQRSLHPSSLPIRSQLLRAQGLRCSGGDYCQHWTQERTPDPAPCSSPPRSGAPESPSPQHQPWRWSWSTSAEAHRLFQSTTPARRRPCLVARLL
jgi:hypothetical protein